MQRFKFFNQGDEMTQHTTGEWWVTENGNVRDSGGLICQMLKAQHYPGQDERYASEVLERQANARLIAAAPMLLEALQKLNMAYVRLLESGRDRIIELGGDCDTVERMEAGELTLKESRAAIAAATGEQA